jgi:hypothetical protein
MLGDLSVQLLQASLLFFTLARHGQSIRSSADRNAHSQCTSEERDKGDDVLLDLFRPESSDGVEGENGDRRGDE